jgi:hypothetical protein
MKTTSNIKKTILVAALLLAGVTASFAQCDKATTFTSSVTNYLDPDGKVERSKDENTVITITKTDITIMPGDDEHKMSGAIISNICSWPTPFKEGKTVIKSKLSNQNGNNLTATITITGTAGKINLTFEAEEMPGKKIQVTADKFE